MATAYLTTAQTSADHPAPMSSADAATPQARHALAMLATTAPGRRRVIQAAAEEYLSQIDGHRLPVGWNQPITDDRYNRVDAYRMRQGGTFARMLGIACQPSDAQLPDTARAILAAIDATPQRLADLARVTGQPGLVALLHLVGATPPSASA
ncbi:hypothetical protein [Streptomyces sp. NPDC048669]|uniref:hypothetical protein n=1 Tax=Streptomyces sp. NPDC048669 TaxID=3155267 RepID=UPI003436FEA6